jgi:hypothetical protein
MNYSNFSRLRSVKSVVIPEIQYDMTAGQPIGSEISRLHPVKTVLHRDEPEKGQSSGPNGEIPPGDLPRK